MRLGGLADVAAEIDVEVGELPQLQEHSDFPQSIGHIANEVVWNLDEVQTWYGRLSAALPDQGTYDPARSIGDRFFRDESPIGRGGFADVYRAVDVLDGSTVAVKFLRDTKQVDVEARQRFQRELRIMEGLSHPNVVQVLAQGETTDGNIWYAMPLAQGSLADHVPSIQGSPPLILEVLRPICAGLTYIHEQGIFHRDLKPGNVLRVTEGGQDHDSWAVSDFGLAVMAQRDTDPLTSTYRQGLGTQVYTAPEQLMNARAANEISDIFGLGKILHELVTGKWPLPGSVPASVFRPVIEKATSYQTSHRYVSVGEFLEALERAVETAQIQGGWESREKQAERLRDRILGRPTKEELQELLDWALSLDEDDSEDMAMLVRVVPWMSVTGIEYLWAYDNQAFTRLVERFCTFVSVGDFSFEYCDTLANFMGRLDEGTGSPLLLGKAVRGMVRLGSHHNRWHVRDVLTRVLQNVSQPDEVVEILEALRDVPIDEIQWSIPDFTLKSLPAPLRSALSPLVRGDTAS